MAGGLFTAFFPDECRLCERPLEGFTRAPVCSDCLASVEPADPSSSCERCGQAVAAPTPQQGCSLCRSAPPPFDVAASYGVYDGNLRRLIQLLKYEKMLPLAQPLAAYMASRLSCFGSIDAVVPVPLHWRKRWQRGFNQSALLAEALAGPAAARYFPKALRRARGTAVQAGLSDLERSANVSGAFTARTAQHLEGQRILLVDDVMTTGATLAAAAKALKDAGAAYVAVLTLALAVRQNQRGASS